MTLNLRSLVHASAIAACASSAALAGDPVSNLSLYGIIDLSITSQDSGAPGAGRQTVLTSGLWSTSRLGLRGSEGLSNGVSALFHLEAGFDAAARESNPDFFNRRSVVGLQGGFGTVKLGREYTPLDSVAGATDPLEQSFYGSTLDAFSSDRLMRRLSNSVSYAAPELGRLKIEGIVGVGEGQAPRAWGAGAAWTGESLYVGGAYLDLRGQGVGSRQYVVGARYSIGDLNLATNHLVADRADSAPRYSQWNIGLNHRFGANKVFANMQINRDGGGARARTLSLGYAYFLSRRTQLYATGAYLHNHDQAVFGLGPASTPPANAPGSSPSALALGIRHQF